SDGGAIHESLGAKKPVRRLGIPCRSGEESQSRRLHGMPCLPDEHDDKGKGQADHQKGRTLTQEPEGSIRKATRSPRQMEAEGSTLQRLLHWRGRRGITFGRCHGPPVVANCGWEDSLHLDRCQLLLAALDDPRWKLGVVQLLTVLLAVVDHPAKKIHHELSLFGGLVDIED